MLKMTMLLMTLISPASLKNVPPPAQDADSYHALTVEWKGMFKNGS